MEYMAALPDKAFDLAIVDPLTNAKKNRVFADTKPMAASHANRTVKKNRIDGEVHFTVMMPPNVHAALADAAKEHRRSMSDEACVIIQEKLFLNSENQTKARLSLLEGRVDALEKSLAEKTGH